MMKLLTGGLTSYVDCQLSDHSEISNGLVPSGHGDNVDLICIYHHTFKLCIVCFLLLISSEPIFCISQIVVECQNDPAL